MFWTFEAADAISNVKFKLLSKDKHKISALNAICLFIPIIYVRNSKFISESRHKTFDHFHHNHPPPQSCSSSVELAGRWSVGSTAAQISPMDQPRASSSQRREAHSSQHHQQTHHRRCAASTAASSPAMTTSCASAKRWDPSPSASCS